MTRLLIRQAEAPRCVCCRRYGVLCNVGRATRILYTPRYARASCVCTSLAAFSCYSEIGLGDTPGVRLARELLVAGKNS